MQDAKDVYRWCQRTLPGLLGDAHVQVDSSRIVAMGHSAGGQLALTTGLCENPPRAIVDFYGCKQLGDAFWTKPSPPFAQIPPQAKEHIWKIFEGPQAITSLPLFIDGKPAMGDPRCAWYITQLRDGKSISSIIPDGDYQRVDATTQLTSDFPPTYFFHGIPDVFVDRGLTVRTHERLRELGVKTKLDLGEGMGHVFDFSLQETDPLFRKHVIPALEFLQLHVWIEVDAVSPVTPSQHGANASIKDGSVLLHPRNVVIIIVINA
jgi:acetyl esterase/lipase